MNLMDACLAIIFLALHSVDGSNILLDQFGTTENVVQKSKPCIDTIRKTGSLIDSRFSDEQVASFCAHQQMWKAGVEDALMRQSDTAAGGTYTPRQQAWLNGIQQCSDLPSCLCLGRAECESDLETQAEAKAEINFLRDATPIRDRSKRKVPPIATAIRKEIRRMTDDERRRFFAAVEELKFDHIDNKSKYDMLTLYHRPESAPGAHWGPGFLGWHRELLRQLEVALRYYDASVTLPYWDSTLDEALPNPKDSVLFSDAFIGDDEARPFAHWDTYYSVGNKHKIVRGMGQTPFGFLLKPSDVAKVLNFTKFEQLTMCVEPFFELVHGGPHNWIGGHMADIPISPDDPSFYLHHTFVDYIWETFRQKRQTEDQRKSDYPEDSICCNSNHYSNAPMIPYPRMNLDGISTTYTERFYHYESSPTCKRLKPDCGSKYLFCDTLHERCMSKIVPGGNCAGFEDMDICFESQCVDKLCLAASISPNTDDTNSVTEKSGTTKLRPKLRESNDTETCDCSRCFNSNDAISKVKGDRPFVYFPITVLKGTLTSIKYPVETAEILSVGNNSTGVFEGILYPSSEEYPNFPGNGIVRIPNPKFDKNVLDMFVSVSTSSPCKAHCYNRGVGYTPCSGKVMVVDEMFKSADLKFADFPQQALFLAWQDREKVPTKMMFLCSNTTADSVLQIIQWASEHCKFQQFPGFQLSDDALESFLNISRPEDCKELCRHALWCTSLHYFPLKEMCVLNSIDRINYPDRFRYEPNEDVIYMDYRCDTEDVLED